MKIIIQPNSIRQWMDWTERLDDAGCEWTTIASPNPNAPTEQAALSSIQLDKIDAEYILGIAILDNPQNN